MGFGKFILEYELMKHLLILVITTFLSSVLLAQEPEARWPSKTHYRSAEVMGQEIFYREAGESNDLTIVLLHGYPSSSHTYRELIPLLSGRYHVIAPDNLGSGFSSKPNPSTFQYSFDTLAKHVDGLLNQLNITKYVLYMQDFGAPVGFRLMMNNPEKIHSIVVQNANAYLAGLTTPRQVFFNSAQTDKSPKNLKKLYSATSAKAVINKQYLRDVQNNIEDMNPDAWTHDLNFLSSKQERKIQVALFQDYKTNLDAYPEWQKLLRRHKFPTLITWGKRDPAFIAAGAEAYLKDLPMAELHLIDAGHFAVEEKPVIIAKLITSFLGTKGNVGTIKTQVNESSFEF